MCAVARRSEGPDAEPAGLSGGLGLRRQGRAQRQQRESAGGEAELGRGQHGAIVAYSAREIAGSGMPPSRIALRGRRRRPSGKPATATDPDVIVQLFPGPGPTIPAIPRIHFPRPQSLAKICPSLPAPPLLP